MVSIQHRKCIPTTHFELVLETVTITVTISVTITEDRGPQRNMLTKATLLRIICSEFVEHLW